MMNIKKLVVVFILSLFLCSGCSQETEEQIIAEGSIQSIIQNHGKEDENTISQIPDYDGEPYVVLNQNEPLFTQKEKQNVKPFETYEKLDVLKRCGQAYANICREIMPKEEREAIGQVKPSGWHTAKYNELVEGNYLYNRCHLIGYQLAGENANEKNLITGTRYLNVMGMLPFENEVDDYVEETGNHVLYRVTPVFENDNLVASGVMMEAWSVEDQGKGVCFNVYCYNVQPGVEIDYETGESREAENADEIIAEMMNHDKSENEHYKEYKYVLNTNTKKYHVPECSSVSDIKKEHRKYSNENKKALKRAGYEPCKRCIVK